MRKFLPLLAAAAIFAAGCADLADQPTETADGAVAAEDLLTTTSAAPADEPASNNPVSGPEKPTDIALPDPLPTELVITVLNPGNGPLAEEGDTVVVDYVGVRSTDGVEFDNSYDRGTPFPVAPLGQASVIQGWNDGLLGAESGSRIQLDIPADLAYGPTARSEIIGENETLTFVIDVRAVIKPADPADAPTEPGVDLSVGATELTTTDLIDGDGPTLEQGQTAVFHLVLFRGDTGEQLDSTWTSTHLQIPMSPDGFPALVQGMPGMNIGGRRVLVLPPELGFGPDGNPSVGLPAGTDAIIVVDLFAAF